MSRQWPFASKLAKPLCSIVRRMLSWYFIFGFPFNMNVQTNTLTYVFYCLIKTRIWKRRSRWIAVIHRIADQTNETTNQPYWFRTTVITTTTTTTLTTQLYSHDFYSNEYLWSTIMATRFVNIHTHTSRHINTSTSLHTHMHDSTCKAWTGLL